VSGYSQRKVVLVTRKTRLEELLARYHSREQARFYLEHLGADFSDYEREHVTYGEARQATVAALSRFTRHQVIDRQFLPNFLFGPDDIVVALGQDGLVANTMKYLDGQPLVGVNPDPKRYDGILLPFRSGELPAVLGEVAQERRDARAVTMAKVVLSDQQVLYAVNDFFVGARTHVSARYEIATGGTQERHSSSGVIVSTGLGSTAWMKSIVLGAQAIAGALRARGNEARKRRQAASKYDPLPWDAPQLMFAVREPFPSVATQTSLVFGSIGLESPLSIRSLMPENGVIFSDGIEADYLQFNAGTEAVFSVAERSGRLIQ
jgi:NAD kinase